MFGGGKSQRAADPAYPVTTAEAPTGGTSSSMLTRQLPAFTTQGLTATARSGRKSLLGGSAGA